MTVALAGAGMLLCGACRCVVPGAAAGLADWLADCTAHPSYDDRLHLELSSNYPRFDRNLNTASD
ncbi:MAG TPA: hypothetical protein VHB68_00980 [Steroidobacteraceae bacterium]|nr:hypothetical protein [Steroidobacteraceae bacterium]